MSSTGLGPNNPKRDGDEMGGQGMGGRPTHALANAHNKKSGRNHNKSEILQKTYLKFDAAGSTLNQRFRGHERRLRISIRLGDFCPANAQLK
jgi:hypothetical protein